MKIDETDRHILNILINDSRKSYREIAKESHVSVATVANRVNQLKKSEIIKGYTTLIDYEEIGYQFHVIIKIRVDHGKEEHVEKKLLNSPNISAIYDKTGEYDMTIIARFKTRRDLDNYLKKIQSFEFVHKTQTSLVLDSIKERPIEVS